MLAALRTAEANEAGPSTTLRAGIQIMAFPTQQTVARESEIEKWYKAAPVGIVAFAFGAPAAIEPNRRIAALAVELSRKYGAPVYTQHDIRIEGNIVVDYAKEEVDGPPPTLRLARAAVAWAAERGIRVLYIVAAEPHLWRVARDMRYALEEAGIDITVDMDDEALKRYPARSWFSSDSSQFRTRSVWRWYPRELILRHMPLAIYTRVAS
jgi:hypothetical protein